MTTIDKATMITKIYEAMARKDLSFWCLIKQHPHIKKTTIYLWDEKNDDSCMWSRFFYVYDKYEEYPYWESPSTYSDDFRWSNKNNKFEIIGHPVLLSDVLNYIDDNEKWQDDKSKHWDILLWNSLYETGKYSWNYSKPTIDDQITDCIEYIYNLIK